MSDIPKDVLEAADGWMQVRKTDPTDLVRLRYHGDKMANHLIAQQPDPRIDVVANIIHTWTKMDPNNRYKKAKHILKALDEMEGKRD